MTEYSRRALLGAAGGALTALAGCASLPLTGGGSDGISYDGPAVLDAVAPDDWVERPTAPYPGSVPDRRADHHLSRGEQRLDSVPRNPDVPNGAVAEAIAAARERAVTALDEAGDTDGLADLAAARSARVQAVRAYGQYRAATEAFDKSRWRARRERASDHGRRHRDSWQHRAVDPAAALLVYRELESLVRAALDATREAGTPPTDPVAAPEAAGRYAGDVTWAAAAVGDAGALRDAYATAEMDAQRDVLQATATTLQQAAERAFQDIEAYHPDPTAVLDVPEDSHRSVLLRSVQLPWRPSVGADGLREHGYLARGTVWLASRLTEVRTSAGVAALLEDGDYDPPRTASAVADRRQAAVDAVREATTASPSELAAIPAVHAWQLLEYSDRTLLGDRHDPGAPSDSEATTAAALYERTIQAGRAAREVTDTLAAALGA